MGKIAALHATEKKTDVRTSMRSTAPTGSQSIDRDQLEKDASNFQKEFDDMNAKSFENSQSQDKMIIPTPDSLPGDCDSEVREFICSHLTAYHGDETFLAGPTPRTLAAIECFTGLLKLEREKGGVLDVDTETPSTITSHAPGYILSASEDVIKGIQTDCPLKRSCKPKGGFNTVEKALLSYGYKPGTAMRETFTKHVKTHNDYVFSMYSKDSRKARHAQLLTGLPDAYGRGRIIGDYRRIAFYGVDELVKRKQSDFDAITGCSQDEMRLRGEITSQIKALKDLLAMAYTYDIDLRKPATTFREAAQAMWLGHIAALKEQDGAAMSVGRWDAFLDIYGEQDLASGRATESDLQEVVDDLILKMRAVRHVRTPEYNALFSGDPTWMTRKHLCFLSDVIVIIHRVILMLNLSNSTFSRYRGLPWTQWNCKYNKYSIQHGDENFVPILALSYKPWDSSRAQFDNSLVERSAYSIQAILCKALN